MQHGTSSSLYAADMPAAALTNMIPQFVRRRLSPLRSFKDIASTYIRSSSSHQRTWSVLSDPSTTESIQPPPPYSEEPPLSDEEEEDDMDDDYASASSSRPSSSGAATPAAVDVGLIRSTTAGQAQFTDDLVRFKFANQGLLLVAQSAQELRTNPHANNEYQRRLYLDGIAYLLRALPERLNDTEVASLQSALPPALRQDAPSLMIEPTAEHDHLTPDQPARRSMMTAVVSMIVFWSFFAFAAALPHLKALARRLYSLERKHKVSEQCLGQGLALLHITYTQMLAIAYTIWTFNDGMIGQILSDLGRWCAKHVGAGVSEGLKEAAAALRQSQGQEN